MFVNEFRNFNQLRNTPGEQIVYDDGEYTRAQFEAARTSEDATPVIIPVRNEAADLPATLRTLADSETPVVPIIVNNASTDNTEELASEMGADVLNWPQPGKMGATQHGIAYVEEELGNRAASSLFTDGDTLVRRGWAGRMRSLLHERDQGSGAGIWGLGIYAHGESKAVDIVRSASFMAKEALAQRRGQLPRGTGFNYGLLFDRDGAMKQAIGELDPEIFRGDDRAIRDAALKAGARVTGSLSLSTMVVSRGDRMGTLMSLLRPDSEREAVRIASYEEQYGAMTAYEKPKEA